MKNNAYKLIDELVSIVEDYHDLKNRKDILITLEKEKSKTIKFLNDLKDSMTDEKYVDMNREMADRNNEINISKDIKKLERKLSSLSDNKNAIKQKLDKSREGLASLQSDFETRNNYWNTIKSDLAVHNKDFYDEEINSLNLLNIEIEKQQQECDALTKEFDCLTIAIDDLTNDIENNKMRLSQIRVNLKNSKVYYDKDLEQQDLNEVEKYNQKLESINKEINELLSTPIIIGYNIKEMIKNDDIYGALKKTKELSERIAEAIEDNKTINYDDVASEIEQLENKTVINAYATNSLDFIKERIDYLKAHELRLLDEKALFTDKFLTQANITNAELLKIIEDLVKKESNLALSLEQHKTYLSSDSDLNESINASIEATQNEIITLRDIANRYRKDLEKTFKEDKKYQSVVKNIDEELENCRVEIEELTQKDNDGYSYDVDEMIKDNERLKELKNIIATRKNVLNDTKSPMELYDQIEMVLGSLNLSEIKSIAKSNISFEKVNVDKRESVNPSLPKEPPKTVITPNMHKVIEIIAESDIEEKEEDYVGIDDIVSGGGNVWN